MKVLPMEPGKFKAPTELDTFQFYCRAKAINRDELTPARTNYKNGDWVYGYVSNLTESKVTMTNEEGISGIDVDRETISRYTGLDTDEDYMIFNGDIFLRQYNNGEVKEYCVVRFELLPTGYGFVFDGFNPDLDIDVGKCQIVGNIYDNPELLEGKYK